MFYSKNLVTPERRTIFFLVAVSLFIIFLARLYQLQVVQYDRFKGYADANRIRMVTQKAPRGIIYDRYGNILADNTNQYNVRIIPYEVSKSKDVYPILAGILDITEEELKRRVRKNWQGQFLPAWVAEDIDFQTLTRLQERKLDLPGVLFSLEPMRSFPSKANLSQVIGYLREVDERDLKVIKDYGYRAGDLIGWKGIERHYESILRGRPGYSYIQVDVYGQEVSALSDRRNQSPRYGNDLYLTIDLSLQAFAESILTEKKGSIVMMDAHSGEILCLVSKPDYSPALFAGIMRADIWDQLRNDPERPLYNRTTQGTYPPGSTFKLITAIAALEEGIIDPSFEFRCRGQYRLGRRAFKCWNPAGHGRMDLHDALVNSCNVYFYHLILKLDLDLWARYARLFRFGERTGIDLVEESAGVVPDGKFLDAKYGVGGWTEGNKLNLVIGQGDLLVTPIQLVRFAATLANRGKMLRPHLGLKYYDKSSEEYRIFDASRPDSLIEISPETWQFIQEAMFEVVNHRRGTGRAARVTGLDIYGKTGTAQNPHGDAHSWFIGFCKYPQRTIAITVLVEHGGSGGGEASLLAARLFKFWQAQERQRQLAGFGEDEDQAG